MCLKTKLKATVGRGVKRVYLNENGDLIFVMTDGHTLNLGNVKNVMPVNFTKDEDSSYTADKTYEEICLAHDSGSYVFAVGVGEYTSFYANLTYKNNKGVMFTAVYPPALLDPNVYEMSFHTYMISDSGVVTVREDQFSFLPSVDADDEGKTVTVSGGAWKLVPMPKVNEIADAVKASMTTEEWTFTLEDGSTVTKAVYVG